MSLATLIPPITKIASPINFNTQTFTFNISGTGWSGSGTIYRILSKSDTIDTPIMFLIVVPNLTAPSTPGGSNGITLPTELHYSTGFVFFHNDGNSTAVKNHIGVKPKNGTPPYNGFNFTNSGAVSNQYAAFFIVGN